MLSSTLARTVNFCFRHAVAVLVLALVVAASAGVYAARHFAISTNIDNLVSPHLPWRQRELAYVHAFPQSFESILAVVESPTPELAQAAQQALADQLSKQPDHFNAVVMLTGGAFFERNSLLFLPVDSLQNTTDKLKTSAPLIRVLAADPSLRGLTQVLSFLLGGVRTESYSISEMASSFDAVADTIEAALAGRPASFSWKALLDGRPANADERRGLISVWAKLDYSNLEPGQAASHAIREAADSAKLKSDFNSDLKLTGQVPLADAEFASLREGALANGIISGLIVLLILRLALGSAALVLAVAVTVGAGLAVTAGAGLLLVGPLNPISVAFVVLFVGLGADFAIQFSVRQRARLHESGDRHRAVVDAASWIGAPLLLAAMSAAAGFFSFIPTDYRGLAELGLISGCGMVVAYLACITVLPAMIALVRPPPEPRPIEIAALAPVDRFLARHRVAVIAITVAVVVAGLPLLAYLRFDFNPLHLRDPSEEAVAAYLELGESPLAAGNPAEVLSQSPAAADAVAQKLSALPQVAQSRTIDSFVPEDQDAKLALISAAAAAVDPALSAHSRPKPGDAENVTALKAAAQNLTQMADGDPAAKRLAGDITRLAEAAPEVRARAQSALVQPLIWDLDELRRALHPDRVTRASLPQSLSREWVAPDGQARVEVVPKGDQQDNANLHRFADAVLQAEPTATGPAIGISKWADTIIMAFVEAAALALAAIALLLWIVLRRVGDMLLTLIPLVAAGIVTLEICSLTAFSLNYANILALPVLLGVGVAFKIYYVSAWRGGETNFLQSVLTRAVFFSALMTVTAFGSLWVSGNPGISSMGKLLMLSLACTLASAALFQPALMGRPRAAKPE